MEEVLGSTQHSRCSR